MPFLRASLAVALLAAVAASPAPRGRVESHAVDDHPTRGDAPPTRQQSHDRPQREALATSRFSDDRERAATFQRERGVVYCAKCHTVARHLDDEPLDLQDGSHSGRNMSASPSPSSDREIPVNTTASPGMMAIHWSLWRKFWPSVIIDPQSGAGGWIPRPR